MKKVIAIMLVSAMLTASGCAVEENKPLVTTAATTEDPNLMEVPDFSGLSRVQIEMKYPKLNINFEEKYSDSVPEDELIGQTPSAGTKINKADEITVEISLGGKLVEVDDYTNRNIDDVQSLLEKQGLICDIIREESDDIRQNCVIRTTPSARTKVEKGTKVICYVSMGAAEQEIKVPDMKDLKIEDATKLAIENNIGLTITYDNNSDLPAGTVISQSIDPETVVEPNTRVEVVISGENAAAKRKTNISVSLKATFEGEFELKYYIDGTLQEEKTEVKEISLTKKIDWEITGEGVHTYSVMVTCLSNGKSGKLYEMEVDFTTDPPKKDHHDTFNANIFKELLNS